MEDYPLGRTLKAAGGGEVEEEKITLVFCPTCHQKTNSLLNLPHLSKVKKIKLLT